jgi:hypothetical protein
MVYGRIARNVNLEFYPVAGLNADRDLAINANHTYS